MAKSQNQVHTTYNQSTKTWRVASAGASRAASMHQTKAAAEAAGRQLAINKQAEHKIHNMDGKISESNSYGRDSFPPRG
jgi:hypothetical protein